MFLLFFYKMIWRKLLFGVIQLLMVINAYRQTDGDISHRDKTDPKRVIEEFAGGSAQLLCVMQEQHMPFIGNSTIRWHFKPCSNLACDSSDNEDTWILLNNTNPILTINNLEAEKDSGLYRCSIEPYKISQSVTLDIQLMITYHLIVIDTTISPPKVLTGYLSNVSANIGETVTFQCRVKSRMFLPSIKWFRKLDNTTLHIEDKSVKAITYLDSTYELLQDGGQMSLGNDIYLSKLMLSNVQFKDVGIYGCVALNYRGLAKQEAYLDVEYPSERKDSGKSSNIKNVFWLFLIPFVFVTAPVIVWMWFYAHKSECRKESLNKMVRKIDNKSSKNQSLKNPYLVVNVEIV